MKNKIIADIKKRTLSEPPKILVVDDDSNNAGTLKKLLEARGYFVQAFYSPQEAIMFFDQNDGNNYPAIVITDYHMPGMTGGKLMEALRSRNLDLKFIIMSGEATEDEIGKTTSDGFLHKPFSLNVLLDEIFILYPHQVSDLVAKGNSKLKRWEEEILAIGDVLREYKVTSLESEAKHIINNKIGVFSMIEFFEDVGKDEFVNLRDDICLAISILRSLKQKLKQDKGVELSKTRVDYFEGKIDSILRLLREMKIYCERHLGGEYISLAKINEYFQTKSKELMALKEDVF